PPRTRSGRGRRGPSRSPSIPGRSPHRLAPALRPRSYAHCVVGRRARWIACRVAPSNLRFRARGYPLRTVHRRAVRLVLVELCLAARRPPPPVLLRRFAFPASPLIYLAKALKEKSISRSWAKSEGGGFLVLSQFSASSALRKLGSSKAGLDPVYD